MRTRIIIYTALLGYILFINTGCAQGIANYVNNGGFEKCRYCNSTPFILRAEHWKGIDTSKCSYQLLSSVIPPYLVPQSSYTYQKPRGGNNYIISSLLFNPYTPNTSRCYPVNTLKQNLSIGKTYCVRFYYNITDKSSYGINALGAYLGDSSIDTITQSNLPLVFLNPQIQNDPSVILTDTVNWVAISGTFTANGTEKYLVLGNFKGDSAIDTIMINPYLLPIIATDILYEDVSCIDIDLEAYAGPDKPVLLGDSVFIGRESDVEIDESCIWYQMTSPTTSITIDTIAGLYVKPVTTTTYVVRQQLWCSGVKWDTVVVYIDAVGLTEQYISNNRQFDIFPNPAVDVLKVYYPTKDSETTLEISDLSGRVIYSKKVVFEKGYTDVELNLKNGVYFITIKEERNGKLVKKLVVAD